MIDNREDIGSKIYDLRRYFHMTQKELCDGICTQAYISKIENGSLAIAADILFKIAERLGVDVNYFYDTTFPERMDYSLEVEIQAREMVIQDNYTGLKALIEKEEKTPLYENRRFKQFILWHKALCKRYVDKDLDASLDLLNEALFLFNTNQKVKSEREIEILINKANILVDFKQYKQAIDLYEDLLFSVKKLPIIRNHNIEIMIRYNLARCNLMISNYEKTIDHAKKGLTSCRNNRSLYGMGHLYFIIGRAYEEIEQTVQALEFFRKAKQVFDLTEENQYYQKALFKLDELQNLHKQV
ncbi:helix-turn-helix domain-containing protein [Allobacillus sp. GCM10007491]|uniref:Helix-turn-helix transcriptional regulator n=1 Tax=Allobacillus saliphilus TaxID=2912308 RepID=A0A941CU19_9BACI|nr:helix-turn-helix domain-containing protein [Allobacillus saliphilus]MBR7553684.1 helix-turn-helix transcriptional regulator [Allobacillus saliphilus]